MDNFFALYDALLSEIPDQPVLSCAMGDYWTGVASGGSLGLAMTTRGDTAPRILAGNYEDMTLGQLARGMKSWNNLESGCGLAAANAYYNTAARLESLKAREPFAHYCTRGLDLTGKRVGVVGHLRMPDFVRQQAGEIFILERNPQPGDYPDPACDWLLPTCQVVILTASTLVNKTLPHLLELCRDAYTILAGPSCPLCPSLLDLGLHRLAGLVVTDVPGMCRRIVDNLPGPPYPMGEPFLLTKEGL